jgi:hypothetical protein
MRARNKQGGRMKKDMKKIIEEKKLQVKKAISKVKPHPFGHGFLWAYVDNKKTCIGMVCADNFDEVRRLAETVEGVKDAWINID